MQIEGLIPAPGEPGFTPLHPIRVYPRAGGGTWSARRSTLQHRRRLGLSPRGRGNLRSAAVRQINAAPGLSPRGRGNQIPRCACTRATFDDGSIPARAGEPCRDRATKAHCATWVYPRAGGGTWNTATTAKLGHGSIPARAGEPREIVMPDRTDKLGLSPRGRGNHGDVRDIRRRSPWGSIPARAGEPACSRNPPGRTALLGSIPARAGEPRLSLRRGDHRGLGVYPRAGGGTNSDDPHRCRSLMAGLSPRGRGNRRIAVRRKRQVRPRVYPRAGGGTPGYQAFDMSTMSKSVGQRGVASMPFYEKDSVRVHDLLWGLAKRLDAEIPDGFRIPPNQND